MKIIIVYDSVYGNTKEIAQAIVQGCQGDHEITLLKGDQSKIDDLEESDLLIVGSPTHGGWYIESIKSFLNAIPENGLRNKPSAAFDTGSSKENEGFLIKFILNLFGYASPRIAKALTNKGATMLGSETFFVLGTEGPLKEGEVDRAQNWAKMLIDKLSLVQPKQ